MDTLTPQNKNNAGKLPPQSVEAEESLLGSLLLDKDAVTKVADIITPQDFYREKNASIFAAMLELYTDREPIDVLTLTQTLKDKGLYEKVGGSGYVSSLVNMVPTASHAQHYAQIVQEKATLRRLIISSSDITNMAYGDSTDLEKLLDSAEQSLFSVSQKYLKQNFIPLREALAEAFERIDEIHREGGKIRGIPTGYLDLDQLLAGFQRSDLIIIAARPSMGKTSLALDIARNIAVKQRVPVGIFSLEMSKEQLVDRMLCAEAGVDLHKLQTGRLGNREEDDDFPRIGQAMGKLSEAPIYIDDSAASNIMEIRTKARRLQSEQNLGLLVVDYLQLMEGRNTENRTQEVSEISRALKQIARELNIPVIALSQLSRAVESRPDGKPKLSDLRESGSIEQDADVVIFIHREDKIKEDSDRKNIADIIVAKHRNGPTGKIELYFAERSASFKSINKDHAVNHVFAPAPPPQ